MHVAWSRREYQPALERYKQALVLYELAGAGELKLAAQYQRMGEVLQLKGELQSALWYLERTLEVRSRLLGKRHCALSHFRLAQVRHTPYLLRGFT